MKNSYELSLREEIAFWRLLKEDSHTLHNTPAHARIEEALALAEYKLQQHTTINESNKLH